MDVNWLEDFVCLARTLSFTRAAQERHVTQPAFSRRIKSLEIWAGTPLIDRSTYPVRLSAAGEELLPVAKEILTALMRNRDQLRERERGGLRLQSFAAMHTVSANHLAPLLRDLAAIDPSLRTRVVSDNLHACCQRLAEGDCDFLLCYRHPHVPLALDEQQYARLDLGTERLLPVVQAGPDGTPRWSLDAKPTVPVPQLAYAGGSFLRAVVDMTLADKRSALRVQHSDAFAETLKSLCLEGLGVAWLSESSISREVADGGLVRAGADRWTAWVALTMFVAVGRLDDQGRKLWEHLAGSAGHAAVGGSASA